LLRISNIPFELIYSSQTAQMKGGDGYAFIACQLLFPISAKTIDSLAGSLLSRREKTHQNPNIFLILAKLET